MSHIFDPATPGLAYLLLGFGFLAIDVLFIISERRRAGEGVRRCDRHV